MVFKNITKKITAIEESIQDKKSIELAKEKRLRKNKLRIRNELRSQTGKDLCVLEVIRQVRRRVPYSNSIVSMD